MAEVQFGRRKGSVRSAGERMLTRNITLKFRISTVGIEALRPQSVEVEEVKPCQVCK